MLCGGSFHFFVNPQPEGPRHHKRPCGEKHLTDLIGTAVGSDGAHLGAEDTELHRPGEKGIEPRHWLHQADAVNLASKDGIAAVVAQQFDGYARISPKIR